METRLEKRVERGLHFTHEAGSLARAEHADRARHANGMRRRDPPAELIVEVLRIAGPRADSGIPHGLPQLHFRCVADWREPRYTLFTPFAVDVAIPLVE